MAALLFDGEDDYATAEAPPFPANGVFTQELAIVRLAKPFNGGVVLSACQSAGRGIYFWDTQFRYYYAYANFYPTIQFAKPFTAEGQTKILRFEFLANRTTVDVYEDGDYLTSIESKAEILSFHSLVRFGSRYVNASFCNFGLLYYRHTDPADAGNNRLWSAALSDTSDTGQQPIIVEEGVGAHAQGFNFITDGSAWAKDDGSETGVDLVFPSSETLSLTERDDLSAHYSLISSNIPMLQEVSDLSLALLFGSFEELLSESSTSSVDTALNSSESLSLFEVSTNIAGFAFESSEDLNLIEGSTLGLSGIEIVLTSSESLLIAEQSGLSANLAISSIESLSLQNQSSVAFSYRLASIDNLALQESTSLNAAFHMNSADDLALSEVSAIGLLLSFASSELIVANEISSIVTKSAVTHEFFAGYLLTDSVSGSMFTPELLGTLKTNQIYGTIY